MNGNAARSGHPLVVLLREIRERHPEVTLTEIEACMGIPFDTLRHIEKGRRPLPGLQDGLGRWILHLLDCVRATPEERAMVETLLSRDHPGRVERRTGRRNSATSMVPIWLPTLRGPGRGSAGEVVWFRGW